MLSDWRNITFANPEFFWAFLLIPVLVLWYILRNKKLHGTVKFGTTTNFGSSVLGHFRHSLIVLKCLALAALITAIARPQTSLSWQDVTTEGRDAVKQLLLDNPELMEELEQKIVAVLKGE